MTRNSWNLLPGCGVKGSGLNHEDKNAVFQNTGTIHFTVIDPDKFDGEYSYWGIESRTWIYDSYRPKTGLDS